MPHTSGSATYPTSSIPPDPYPKMPLSGAPGYTAEPQEMPMQQTSMPSVQLPLVAQDQQQPPIRAQFATYVQGGSSAPPHLSLSTTATTDNSLAIPRYVDTNPRPSKSPRHASHQSVGSSISNETASGEYRYGPPPPQYAPPPPTNTNDVLSPQSQHHHLPPLPAHAQGGAPAPPGYGPAPSQDANSSASSSAPAGSTAGGGAPASQRDYYPPSYANGGGHTPHQGSAGGGGEGGHAGSGAGGNGSGNGAPGGAADRPYAFPASHVHVKAETQHAQAPGPAPPQGYGGYAWNAA